VEAVLAATPSCVAAAAGRGDRRMTLQQLRYFLAACRYGSFTAAADALYIAQPSVAEQIRRLEQEWGVRLFVRTGRRLELTESGRRLQGYADRVITAVRATETAMQEERNLQGGAASIGTVPIAQRYLVNEVVTTFVARHPDVTLRVVGRHSAEVIQLVRTGELEAGLVALPVDEPALVVDPVMSDEILYAAAPGPDTAAPMSLEQLAGTRLIGWPATDAGRDSIRGHVAQSARKNGIEIQACIEVEELDSALDLASKGFGGTLVPRSITESTAWPRELEAVSLELPMFHTYALVWRRDHQLSPASAELVRLARRQIKS